MDEDLFDEGAKRLFPGAWARVQAAQARVVPGTSRRRTTVNPTSGDPPGRTSPDRSRVPAHDDFAPVWARHPTYIGSSTQPFYAIGALAAALERSPVTLRGWIAKGWMPEARYRRKTADVRGRRRYYTRKQIEGLAQIAEEERLPGTKRRNPDDTHFPQRARELFDGLAAEARRTT